MKLTLALALGQGMLALADEPKVVSEPFNLTVAEQAFTKGTLPSAAALSGDWRLVGVAGPSLPSSLGYVFPCGNAYNADGITDGKGTPLHELFITHGGEDFAGNPLPDEPVVRLSGLNGGEQGPYAVTLNDHDKAASFAQYTYDIWPQYRRMKSYLTYACRLVAGSAEKMTCRLSFTMVEDDLFYFYDQGQNSAVDEYRGANARVVEYLGYVKSSR